MSYFLLHLEFFFLNYSQPYVLLHLEFFIHGIQSWELIWNSAMRACFFVSSVCACVFRIFRLSLLCQNSMTVCTEHDDMLCP